MSYLKLPEEAKYEIDNESDLIIVEALLKKNMKLREGGYFKKIKPSSINYDEYFLPKEDPDGVMRNFLEESQGRIDLCKNEINYINSLIKDDKPKTIIDIGCGNGFVSSKFDDKYIKYGIEVSNVAAEIALKHIPNINKKALDSDSYPEEFFDVVFWWFCVTVLC